MADDSKPRSAFLARRAWLSAGAPIVALVACVTLLFFAVAANFARMQDQGFERDSRRLMQSALDERARALANQSWDYGFWDDAYQSITLRLDQDWTENNYFTLIADGLVVLRDGAPDARYAWFSEDYRPDADRLTAQALAAIRAALAQRPHDHNASDADRNIAAGAFTYDGQLVRFAAAPIQPASSDAPHRDHVAIIEIFDAAEIRELAAARDLENAAFTTAPAAPAGSVALPVAGPGGVLGQLAWRNERPGSAAFVGDLWPILLALAAIAAVTLFVARRLVQSHVHWAARAEAALEASRMRAEFISTMSHELRTPLNAIIGYAELIKEEALPDDAGQSVQADADHVLAAAKHLRQLVDDILDHSRLDAGRLKLTLERLPVAGLLAEIAEVAEPLARAQGNAFSVSSAVAGGEVIGDDVRVRQCLMHLVTNANKFTQNGAVAVSARPELRDGAAFIVFDVADSGVGIEKGLLERLFQPFVQAQTGIHSAYDGAGLGLSISQKLARAMGGDIAVVSEPGRGSVFSLALPAAGAERQAPRAAA